ncbi:NAD-dependent epimerase/dehydratase family protein [Legionella sp. W05-934-2]|uniref:NAD-dependent epimerase/dehydratase family protein n=1 Tax=Legionella sp. W05-934-2 TaxID=1198649 RepID=UPI003462F927
MKHLLIGYGYTASYLLEQLIAQGETVEAYSRTPKPIPAMSAQLIVGDVINQGIGQQADPFFLYYFISPPNQGTDDAYLRQFLQRTDLTRCQGIIYISSSAVYGDHHGERVDETSDCYITTDRQKRRLDAEMQVLAISQQRNIPALILRCAGIYGQNRLPIEAARIQKPIILSSQAPLTNLIYVADLAYIINTLVKERVSGIFNVADGKPRPMGYLQQTIAQQLNYPAPHELPYSQLLEQATEMKRFFMESSKQLDVRKLLAVLPKDFQFTQMTDVIHQCFPNQGDN